MARTNGAQTPVKSPGIISKAHNQKKSGRVRKGTIIPIIKIVHVYAPTLVTTDVEHFRTLVQQMTGNDGAASHDIKDVKAACCVQASTDDDEVVSEDKLGPASSRTLKALVCAHREGASSTLRRGVCLGVQGGKREGTHASDQEEGEACCEYGDVDEESSCEQSVDNFFAESEVCFEEHFCKVQPQQTYCGSVFFATTSAWRPPQQEIPGGFESFDCF